MGVSATTARHRMYRVRALLAPIGTIMPPAPARSPRSLPRMGIHTCERASPVHAQLFEHTEGALYQRIQREALCHSCFARLPHSSTEVRIRP